MKITRLKVEWDDVFRCGRRCNLSGWRSGFVRAHPVADRRGCGRCPCVEHPYLVSSLTSYLDIEASGDDEQEAVQAVVEHFNHNADRLS